MQLVNEVILLNKILRNLLLSENMQWNYVSFNVTLNYFMHEITEFCVTYSLALDNWEQKSCQTLGNKPNHSHRVQRGRFIFQGKIFHYQIVCFTQCTLFFQNVHFLLPICLPCVISGSYVTKITVVLWHNARQTFASLGLFTLPVYVRSYCVPTATLNQNKRTRLLYLSDAQIINRILDFPGDMH